MTNVVHLIESNGHKVTGPAERCIRAAFEAVGIDHFRVPHEIGALLSITAKQARRKLKENIWSLEELLALQRRCGVSLGGVLQPDEADGWTVHRGIQACLLVNGEADLCEISLGTPCTKPRSKGLVCTKHKGRWIVSTPHHLNELCAHGIRFTLEYMRPIEGSLPLRVAVLDDEIQASRSLAEWFSESGHPAQPFTTIEQLEAAGLDAFDVFIVDVVLAGGRTSHELVVRIREADPMAIVVLLTGQLRTRDMETEIAGIVRDQRVEFHAKPTSPLVLLSTVLNAVARRDSGISSD